MSRRTHVKKRQSEDVASSPLRRSSGRRSLFSQEQEQAEEVDKKVAKFPRTKRASFSQNGYNHKEEETRTKRKDRGSSGSKGQITEVKKPATRSSSLTKKTDPEDWKPKINSASSEKLVVLIKKTPESAKTLEPIEKIHREDDSPQNKIPIVDMKRIEAVKVDLPQTRIPIVIMKRIEATKVELDLSLSNKSRLTEKNYTRQEENTNSISLHKKGTEDVENFSNEKEAEPASKKDKKTENVDFKHESSMLENTKCAPRKVVIRRKSATQIPLTSIQTRTTRSGRSLFRQEQEQVEEVDKIVAESRGTKRVLFSLNDYNHTEETRRKRRARDSSLSKEQITEVKKLATGSGSLIKEDLKPEVNSERSEKLASLIKKSSETAKTVESIEKFNKRSDLPQTKIPIVFMKRINAASVKLDLSLIDKTSLTEKDTTEQEDIHLISHHKKENEDFEKTCKDKEAEPASTKDEKTKNPDPKDESSDLGHKTGTEDVENFFKEKETKPASKKDKKTENADSKHESSNLENTKCNEEKLGVKKSAVTKENPFAEKDDAISDENLSEASFHLQLSSSDDETSITHKIKAYSPCDIENFSSQKKTTFVETVCGSIEADVSLSSISSSPVKSHNKCLSKLLKIDDIWSGQVEEFTNNAQNEDMEVISSEIEAVVEENQTAEASTVDKKITSSKKSQIEKHKSTPEIATLSKNEEDNRESKNEDISGKKPKKEDKVITSNQRRSSFTMQDEEKKLRQQIHRALDIFFTRVKNIDSKLNVSLEYTGQFSDDSENKVSNSAVIEVSLTAIAMKGQQVNKVPTNKEGGKERKICYEKEQQLLNEDSPSKGTAENEEFSQISESKKKRKKRKSVFIELEDISPPIFADISLSKKQKKLYKTPNYKEKAPTSGEESKEDVNTIEKNHDQVVSKIESEEKKKSNSFEKPNNSCHYDFENLPIYMQTADKNTELGCKWAPSEDIESSYSCTTELNETTKLQDDLEKLNEDMDEQCSDIQNKIKEQKPKSSAKFAFSSEDTSDYVFQEKSEDKKSKQKGKKKREPFHLSDYDISKVMNMDLETSTEPKEEQKPVKKNKASKQNASIEENDLPQTSADVKDNDKNVKKQCRTVQNVTPSTSEFEDVVDAQEPGPDYLFLKKFPKKIDTDYFKPLVEPRSKEVKLSKIKPSTVGKISEWEVEIIF